MPACSAFGCTNRPGKQIVGLSFHRFPRNVLLKKAWVLACKRANWQPSSVSVLCSNHFTEDLIDRSNPTLVRLKRNAVPNVFAGFPSYLQKDSKNRKSPAKCQNIPHVNRLKKVVSSSKLEDSEFMEIDTEKADQTALKGVEETTEEVDQSALEGVEETTEEADQSALEGVEKTTKEADQNALERVEETTKEADRSALEGVEETISNKTDAATSPIKELNDALHQDEIVKRLKQQLAESESLVLKYREKIKTLQQKSRRQKIKHSCLKNLPYQHKELVLVSLVRK